MSELLYQKFNDIHSDETKAKGLSKDEQHQYFNQFCESIHPKQTNKKRFYKSKNKLMTLAAAASILIGGTFSITNEEIQANAVKWIDNIQYSFKDIMSTKAEKFATHVNETISLKHADVKLADVFAQGQFLSYNELVDEKGKNSDNISNASPISLKINGKEMMEGYSGSSENMKPNLISNIGIIHLREAVPTDKYQVELKIDPMNRDGEVYSYQFEVNPKTLNEQIKSTNINKVFSLKSSSVKVQQLILNPLSATIQLTSNSDHNFDVFVYDEKGKKYYFNVIQTKEEKGINQSVLVFNQDIDSTGTIDDLNKATHLKMKVIDYGNTHNGESKVIDESKVIKVK